MSDLAKYRKICIGDQSWYDSVRNIQDQRDNRYPKEDVWSDAEHGFSPAQCDK